MQKQLIPYYASRAILCALFGYAMSLNSGVWAGVLIGLVMMAGFIWYAYSGRYLVEPRRPLTPLRRDARGKEIRNRALVAAVGTAGVIYGGSALAGLLFPLPENMGTWALTAGIAVYFAVSNWMFSRDSKYFFRQPIH